MSDTGERPLIDYQRVADEFEVRRREAVEHPERARILTRAKVRLVRDYLCEADVARFKVVCDEDAPMGSGQGPRPLQYFVAAVGF